ncbi:MAG: PIN domain-containing protein [Candidatus Bilamarchaeaceae archaeon]
MPAKPTKLCLDTEVVLDFFRGDQKTVQKIRQYSQRDILCITSLTYFELLVAIRGPEKWDVIKAINNFEIMGLDGEVSVKASRIYEQLKEAKAQAGLREILNAAICTANDALLFTKNRQAYEGIRGLNFV